MPKSIPTPEELRKLLRYDPGTGKLFWRHRTPDMFECKKYSADRRCRRWNTIFAEKEALTTGNCGYKTGKIMGKGFLSHRVAWAIYYGEWPENVIDHINGDRSDNRISNLRSVEVKDNARNRRPRKIRPYDLPPGVSMRPNGRYRAQINFNYKNYHLGYFSTQKEAVDAYEAAKIEFGFHENHGRTLDE